MKHLKDYIYQIKRYYYIARIKHDIRKGVVSMRKLDKHIMDVPSFRDLDIDRIFAIENKMWRANALLSNMEHDAMAL